MVGSGMGCGIQGWPATKTALNRPKLLGSTGNRSNLIGYVSEVCICFENIIKHHKISKTDQHVDTYWMFLEKSKSHMDTWKGIEKRLKVVAIIGRESSWIEHKLST